MAWGRGAPSRVETLREIAKSAKTELGAGEEERKRKRKDFDRSDCDPSLDLGRKRRVGRARKEQNRNLPPNSDLAVFAISRRVSTRLGATCVV